MGRTFQRLLFPRILVHISIIIIVNRIFDRKNILNQAGLMIRENTLRIVIGIARE